MKLLSLIELKALINAIVCFSLALLVHQSTICPILQDLVKQKNATILVKSNALAYYLLIIHPEYIAEGDSAESLLKAFCNHCDNLQDEISFKLLSNAYALADNEELAQKYSKQTELVDQIDTIIASKINLNIDDTNEIDFESI